MLFFFNEIQRAAENGFSFQPMYADKHTVNIQYACSNRALGFNRRKYALWSDPGQSHSWPQLLKCYSMKKLPWREKPSTHGLQPVAVVQEKLEQQSVQVCTERRPRPDKIGAQLK